MTGDGHRRDGARRSPAAARLAAAIGLAVAGVGGLVLVGWSAGWSGLTRVATGLESMKPWTAVSLVGLGAAMAATAPGTTGSRRLAMGLAGLVLLLAVGSLVEYAFGSLGGFDTLLFPTAVEAEGARLPGRMAPMTAVGLSLSAAALLVRERSAALAHALASLSLAVAAVAVTGYLFGAESLRRVGPYSSVAAHTAITLLVANLGILLLNAERGLVALARRGRSAKLLIRVGVPIVVTAPFLLGWLRLRGQRAGWFDANFGVALMVVSSAAVGLGVLWRAAATVAAHEEELEDRVRDRTEALAATEASQRASLESLEQGVAMSDLTGRVLLLNRAGRELLGYSSDELTDLFQSGRWETFDEHGVSLDVDHRPVGVTMRTGAPVTGAIVRWRRSTGDTVLLRVSTQPVRDQSGALLGVVTAFADITVQRQAEQEVLASRARFAALVERSSDIICVIDAEARLRYLSPAGERLLGPRASVVGAAMLDLVHPGDALAAAGVLAELSASPGVTRTIEMRVKGVDGSWHHVEAVATNRLDEPAVGGIVANVRDVTERAEAAARITYQAFHDSLTGLPNRALLLDRLGHALERARRTGSQAALLFIDLDLFKSINDTMGHEAGDQVLVEVATRITRQVRADDTVARLGGDEFVVLAEELGHPGEAEGLAQRIIHAIAEPYLLPGGAVSTSASVGIAFDNDHRPDSLLRDADTAQYRAKEQGRDRYAIFDEGMRVASVRRVETERLLRQALELDGLRLHYQPIVELTTGRLVAVEALLRLQGTEGLQAPGQFLRIAEETGLIVQIGAGVLDLASSQLARWRTGAVGPVPARVAVNVSARQLASASFVRTVERALDRHGLEPSDLALEMTESTIIGADRSTTAAISTLHELGVTLAIDDFGTGFSSLAYLKRFPVDWVKLDASFVDGLGHDHRDTQIVRAVIELGGALGLMVIAEGIETPVQLEALQALGCDCGQGFLLARPEPPEDLDLQIAQVHAALRS